MLDLLHWVEYAKAKEAFEKTVEVSISGFEVVGTGPETREISIER